MRMFLRFKGLDNPYQGYTLTSISQIEGFKQSVRGLFKQTIHVPFGFKGLSNSIEPKLAIFWTEGVENSKKLSIAQRYTNADLKISLYVHVLIENTLKVLHF